jgi:hypothetical protein
VRLRGALAHHFVLVPPPSLASPGRSAEAAGAGLPEKRRRLREACLQLGHGGGAPEGEPAPGAQKTAGQPPGANPHGRGMGASLRGRRRSGVQGLSHRDAGVPTTATSVAPATIRCFCSTSSATWSGSCSAGACHRDRGLARRLLVAPSSSDEGAAIAAWQGRAVRPFRELVSAIRLPGWRTRNLFHPQAQQGANTGPETSEVDAPPEDADRHGHRVAVGHAAAQDATSQPQ